MKTLLRCDKMTPGIDREFCCLFKHNSPERVNERYQINGIAKEFNPDGTVFFIGYGSSLTETDAFSFRDLARVNDGFFVKLSYLFRV